MTLTYHEQEALSPLHKVASTFGGLGCAQRWVDFYLWEQLLNVYDSPGGAIIELGTSWGGFSAYLKIQAELRKMRFYTFDIEDKRLSASALANNFVLADILEDTAPVKMLIDVYKDPQVILFCDNGDKEKEVELYAPMLDSGNVLVVHDWGSEKGQPGVEFGPANVPDELEEIMGTEFDEVNSMSRAFQKV